MTYKAKTEYVLRDPGEVSGETIVPADAMYVDVKTSWPNGRVNIDTLVLPRQSALDLAYSMSPPPGRSKQLIQNVLAERLLHPSLSHWLKPKAFLGLMRWLFILGQRQTAWLGHADCKYIDVRIDMRGGHFIVKDGSGNSAESALFGMIGEEEIRLKDTPPV